MLRHLFARLFLITALVGLVFVTGCERPAEPEATEEQAEAPQMPETTAPVTSAGDDAAPIDGAVVEEQPTTFEDVSRETGEALSAMGRYSVEKKDELVAATQEQIAALGEKAQELRARAEQAGTEAQEQWSRMSAELDEKMEQAKDQLSRLRTAGEEGWQETRSRTAWALTELQKVVGEAARAIAPDEESTGEEAADGEAEQTPPITSESNDADRTPLDEGFPSSP
jgi:hypothetical protein